MEPIFDRNGKTVGWLREDVVYSLSGVNLAFLFRGAVFDFQGHHLGSFSHKFFRDEQGKAVAFVRGAIGVQVPQTASSPPVPAVPSTLPSPPRMGAVKIPDIPPVQSLSWSNRVWEQFVSPGRQPP